MGTTAVTAAALLEELVAQAPDFLSDQVAALRVDSLAKVARLNLQDAYVDRYQQVALLALDPLTVDAARQQWRRLRGFDYLAKVITGVKFKDGIEVTDIDQAAA